MAKASKSVEEPVLLGFVDEEITTSTDLTNHTTSKIGGKPVRYSIRICDLFLSLLEPMFAGEKSVKCEGFLKTLSIFFSVLAVISISSTQMSSLRS